jgi:16S rRNA (guanine527-N7)-methyltransferase
MELLRQGARDLGLTLSPGHIAQFERYYQELNTWNQRFNLTAITGYGEVQVKHFLDSLTCLLAFPHAPGDTSIPDTVPLQVGSRSLWCVDVGSGAGFPGLPIKIMLPEAEVTLVEATGKKVTFLQHMVKVLGLNHVNVLHARAEDVAHLPEQRERYDIVVARAVAHLSVLAEYCLPLLRVGGRMIAPKGEEAADEAAAAERSMDVLGGVVVGIKPVQLPEVETPRYLVVVDKVHKTPEEYPRRAGIPSKRPL